MQIFPIRIDYRKYLGSTRKCERVRSPEATALENHSRSHQPIA